jgi:hypothetical protein
MGSEPEPQEAPLLTHERLGPYRAREGLMEVRVTCDREEYAGWENRLHTVSRLDCENILLPQDYLFLPGTCSVAGEVRLAFPEYLHALAGEVAHRRSTGSPFSEQELLYLMFSMLKNAMIAQSLREPTNAWSTANILINGKGHAKALTPFSMPRLPSNLRRAIQQDYGHCLLSPEEMGALAALEFGHAFPSGLCEAFTLGLCFLEIGCLLPAQDVMDFTRKQVRFELLAKRLAVLRGLYSDPLVRLISTLLEQDARKRPCPGQMFYFLKPYTSEINSLEPFRISPEQSISSVVHFLQVWNENSNDSVPKVMAEALQQQFCCFKKELARSEINEGPILERLLPQ